jgi:hypothetical protein
VRRGLHRGAHRLGERHVGARVEVDDAMHRLAHAVTRAGRHRSPPRQQPFGAGNQQYLGIAGAAEAELHHAELRPRELDLPGAGLDTTTKARRTLGGTVATRPFRSG